jgi:tRNA threonylcarbamoyladenosine biosynthesis protein TsaB
MGLILCLETATPVCSVALSENGIILSHCVDATGYSHAERLTLLAEETLEKAGKKFSDLDAVAVSAGPGSYTGLRIGVSTAKGYCFGLNLPLISVPTLAAMTAAFQLREIYKEGFFIPMIDARRMEVFAAVFNHAGQEVQKAHAEILTEASYSEFRKKGKVFCFGDGAKKVEGVIPGSENFICDGTFQAFLPQGICRRSGKKVKGPLPRPFYT